MGPNENNDKAFFAEIKPGMFIPIEHTGNVPNVTDLLTVSNKINEEPLTIERVIFNEPATIVFWSDGTKTVVKCMDGDCFSYDAGIYAATLKKIFGPSYSEYKNHIKRIIAEEVEVRREIMERFKKAAEEEYEKTWRVKKKNSHDKRG